ncbi:MAG TPA: transposase [Candidatus Hodarchaeales archaeon]|nr:transposase [Candidatus Hodarchaeales archaeon]
MKKPNKETVRQQVWSEIDKLFELNVEGSDGWKYARQAAWRPADVFKRLVQADLEQMSIEDVCTYFEGCSADTIHRRVSGLQFDPTMRILNDMLRYSAQGFHIHGNERLTVAIDITDSPWYGDCGHEFSVGSKMKEGTQFFNRYFTACLLTRSYRIPLYVRPIRLEDGVSPYDLVEEFLREVYWWLPFQRLLADSWFFSADLLDLFALYRLEFIIPLKRQKRLRTVMEDIQATQRQMAAAAGVDISQPKHMYRWLKKHSLQTFTFEMIFTMRASHRYKVTVTTVLNSKQMGRNRIVYYLDLIVFTTNILASGDYLKNEYRRRWGIETQYRVVHQFQGRTTSLSTNLRVLLFGLGLVLVAIWLRLNAFLQRISEKIVKKADFHLPLRVYARDRLVMTGKRLRRIIQSLWRSNR